MITILQLIIAFTAGMCTAIAVTIISLFGGAESVLNSFNRLYMWVNKFALFRGGISGGAGDDVIVNNIIDGDSIRRARSGSGGGQMQK